MPEQASEDIAETVRRALAEDLGGGDITAALISEINTRRVILSVKIPGVFAVYRGRSKSSAS